MLSRTGAGNTAGKLKCSLACLSLESLLGFDSTALWDSEISWQHQNSEWRAASPCEGTVAAFAEGLLFCEGKLQAWLLNAGVTVPNQERILEYYEMQGQEGSRRWNKELKRWKMILLAHLGSHAHPWANHLCQGIQACSPNVLSGVPSLWETSGM